MHTQALLGVCTRITCAAASGTCSQRHVTEDRVAHGCSTLLKVVGNLVDKPHERRFRCIRKAGAAFHEALGKLPGGDEALRAVGFCDATEPNGDAVSRS